ncbi:ethanolamine permease [Nocardia otitidiscaviarum]|uniref:Ethanolamine permease n=1 Tax=Nocardia otitidiscaviarum TaxID=1823 RepID=A0A378YUL0_9NOCA|nr:ethanolamine permease [Nocardia otitidiscaviarum]
MTTASRPTADTAEDYLAKRTLRSGSAGWLLLAGLGVSYVISGDYSGWNSAWPRADSVGS